MHHVPKLHTRKSRPSLIAIFRVVCAAFWLAVPQTAWSQAGGPTSQAKASTEGDRLTNAGIKAYRQGQIPEAFQLLEQAKTIYTQELGEDHPNTLSSMNNLANTYGALGQHEKALALQEQTLKLMRAKLDEDHPYTLSSMGNLANTYGALGQHEKSLALKEQTLKLMRAKLGEDHPDTLRLMGSLALTYRDIGQYDKALALQEQTLKLMRAKLGEDHPYTLSSMGNLANIYRDLGQHNKTLVLNEQALKLRRAKLGEDHPHTLTSMSNLAATYIDLGQHEKVLALQEQTLKLRRTKLGEDHPDTLSSMNNLALTYRALDRHDKALEVQEQTLKLMRAKLGEDHPNTLGSMSNLANAYRTLGQHEKALALHEQTLKLTRAKLGEDHPDTLSSMNNLALTYRALGQHEKALALIPAIVAGTEKLRVLPGLATEQRQSLFANYSDRYLQYATWYAGAKSFGDAFNLGDISKARTLTDSIKAQVALRSLPAAEQLKLQASGTRAQALRLQIDKLSAQGTRDSGALLALQKQLDAHGTDHVQLVASLNNRYPKYAQLISLKPATASQAKQLIGDGEVFVSYLIHTSGMAQAFLLDASGEAKWVDLGQIKNHARTVAAYRELVSPSTKGGPKGQLVALKDGGYQWLQPAHAVPSGASKVTEPLKVLNRYWHDALIKPILPVAGPYARWVISPDKDLALLPFDTLVEVLESFGNPVQTLVQTRNITLVQSFSVFMLLKQREAEYDMLQRPKDLLAMGNAVYDSGWVENQGMQRGSTRGYATRSGAAADRGYALPPMRASAEQTIMNELVWKNLPGTAHEIQEISAVFSGKTAGGGANVDTYLGLDASEGKLLQLNEAGKLKDYRYLLFSAHGYLAQNSALSSLVLSRQGNPAGIDGYVTAGEWPLYDMKSDLTVLSACDTGVGKTLAGESVMGLPYALFVAGNRNTLLSLWPVDDNATAEFMRRFFTKLKAGTSQLVALRQTKQEFRQHPKWSDPRYWAAFVLYGV
ncbi:MAG: CHAT domain-containing tetratricopeptide repeat protein [Pseudomonadota bacterium]